jgi:putative restriction endonuclease
MQLYVGITDDRWFEFLSQRQPDEVNFWRPKSQDMFRALQPGEIFLFKLHTPQNFIVGGGVFVRHTFFPLRLAWDAFEQKNGVPDYVTLKERILGHRGVDRMELPLGCTVLVEPFFWSRDLWIPMPIDWPKSGVMEGKRYDTTEPIGAALWAEVQARLQSTSTELAGAIVNEPQARYGEARLVKPRLGQGAFRVEVTDTYNRRCAITGERTLPALAACHIKPFADNGPHQIDNGLLLRSDLHNLFDLGYLTVTLDYKVKVSRRIREEFENGRHYYALDNQPLQVVPQLEGARPAREFLEWHHGVFKG